MSADVQKVEGTVTNVQSDASRFQADDQDLGLARGGLETGDGLIPFLHVH